MLDYPDDPAEFGARIRELTDGNGVAAVYDGVGASTFDASLASLAVRGTLALFGAASGPVPPFDPQRLNAAGSVFLTRPIAGALHPHRRRIRLACRRTARRDRRRRRSPSTVSNRYPLRRRGPGAPRSAGPQDRRLGGAGALGGLSRSSTDSSAGRSSAESTASAQNTTAR